MKKYLPWLLVILVIGAAAWCFWYFRQPNTSTVVVTSPAGGETWQSGEKHVISWKTRGISKDNKISVIIRRIPPPPLKTEGQEFDPIVFFDLPNTGSVEWEISPMYPDGNYVLEVHSYGSIPVTDDIFAESALFTISHPVLSADLYPLYTGATWSTTTTESFLIGDSSYTGTSIFTDPISVGMNPASIITPFSGYYDGKLKALGWSEALDLDAGGHIGGQAGYRKDGEIILTRFRIDYQNNPENAPSECPCDVTLLLFSTGK
ncbi:MAG: hypothetical protein WC565_00445 [Parcubacteria group bacterium]